MHRSLRLHDRVKLDYDTVAGSCPVCLSEHSTSVASGAPHLILNLSGLPQWSPRDGARPVALLALDAALLAWLAVEGPTPRPRLVSLLWPDSTPAAAGNALRQRLFQLRRQMKIEVATGSAVLALGEGVRHDLDAADTILEGQAHDHGEEFAAWLAAQRAWRTDRARQRLSEAADAAEGRREWEVALQAAQRLVALDPLREPAHRRLMRLHYLVGDRAAALQAFDRCEQLLKDEVGTRPDEETLGLLRQIASSGSGRPAAMSRIVPPTVLRPPRLIGREAEWARIEREWCAGCTLLVAGEGGIGKSRLLGELASMRPSGVVSAGARPGDVLLPYALLSRLLRALLAREGMAIAPGVAGELSRLLPELGGERDAVPGSERTRFVNAVESTVAQAASHGLDAVLVDDLHLADAASAELLLGLCADSSLRFVFAWRDAELPASTRTATDALMQQQRAMRVELAPLTLAESVELLESLGIEGVAEPEQALQLHRRTGGNPLYLLETVKALLADGRESTGGVVALPAVQQIISQRIGTLSPAAVKLARCAAVAGQDVSAALACAVLEMSPLDLADPWNELQSAQVLRESAFAHDLIYEAALASVPAPLARELHLQIARFLEGRGSDPSRIAAHWLAGGEPLPAVPHLRAAAELARQRFCYFDAGAIYEQAAGILEDAGDAGAAFDAWFSAADAVASFGNPALHARHAARLNALACSDEQLAKAAMVDMTLAVESGRFDDAIAAGERGLPHARKAGLGETESDILYMLGGVHWERRDVSNAAALVERAMTIRRALPVEALRPDHASELIVMTQAFGTILGGAGRFAEAIATVQEAHRLATSAGQMQAAVGAAADLCARCMEHGDLAAALRWAEQAVPASSEAAANASDLAFLWMARAHTLVLAGRWGEALAQYDLLLQRLPEDDERRRLDVAARLALFHAQIGRRDLALKAVRAHRVTARGTPVQRLWLDLVALALGEPVDRAEVLERVVAVDDVGLRMRMLVRLAPHADSKTMLPVLRITGAAARSGGLLGQWLTLRARTAALLADAGRHKEAQACAHDAWQAYENGASPTITLPEFAADVRRGLAVRDPDAARSVATQALDWFTSATRTLPAPWADNCAARSPLRDELLRAPHRAAASGPLLPKRR